MRKNPRRQVVAFMNDLRKFTRWVDGHWNVRMSIWDRTENHWRDRRDDEKPENIEASWGQLRAAAAVLRERADALEAFVDSRGQTDLGVIFTK